MICNTFLLLCVFSFNFLMMPFEAQKFLIFLKSNLLIFSLLFPVLLVSYLRTHCLTQGGESFHLWFFSKSFVFLVLFLCLESILIWFLYMVWGKRSKLIIVHVETQLSQPYLLKRHNYESLFLDYFWSIDIYSYPYPSTTLYWLL